RLLLADVEGLVLEAPGHPGGKRGRLNQRLLAAAAGDDSGAEADQLQRRLAPEAAAGSGDDANLIVEQTVPEHLRMRACDHRRAAYRRAVLRNVNRDE